MVYGIVLAIAFYPPNFENDTNLHRALVVLEVFLFQWFKIVYYGWIGKDLQSHANRCIKLFRPTTALFH